MTNQASALAGKRILVSGAASGMGAVCAEVVRMRGASVYAVDRDEPGMATVAERIDASWEAFDLSRVDEIPGLVQRCSELLGGLDGLVNAAGVFQTRELLEITPADYNRIFAINVRGLFFLQQAAARVMVERRGGSIVNFASTAARVPRPLSSHYAAGKAAVVSFTRSAAAALGGFGIRVNAIAPGSIETPMIERVRQERARLFDTTPEQIDARMRAAIPMGRLGSSQEVAEVVAFLLSDASSYVSGECLGITGGSDFD